MTLRMLTCVGMAVALAAGLPLRAERIFAVKGVVRAPLVDGRIVVAHEDIAGFMPAMTMSFDVAASATAAARGLQPGDRVEFALQVDDDHSSADGFRVVGHVAAKVPVASRPSAVRRLHEGDLVPAFNLVDEQSHPFTGAQLADRVTLLTFVFTRCPVPEFCPLIARRFAELQKAIRSDPALGPRAQLVSVTLDPEFDRPAVLAAYGQAVGADPATWRFVTGETADVNAFVKAFSVYTERNGVTLDHTLCTALISGDGRIVELWRGNGWATTEVLTALRAAK